MNDVSERTVFSYRGRWAMFLGLAVAGCTADLLSKAWVFAWPELSRGRVHWLIEGYAGIQRSLNEGALFGIGQGGSSVFAVVSIAAAVAIPIWLFCYGAASSRLLTFALGLVTGGVLGNLYDRLGMPELTWGEFDPARRGEAVYAVRDWILVQANDQWRWPNFNIADSLLVCGAGLLFVHAFLHPGDATQTEGNQGNQPGRPEATSTSI